MKATQRFALSLIALVPLASMASAQAERARGQERTGQEAARAQEEARAKAREQEQRARDDASRREREAKAKGEEKGVAEKNPRVVANEIAKLEAMHRERMARIKRLMEVYREEKNMERLAELEKLRDAQVKRYENARNRLKERVGAAEFERIDGTLAPGRKPGAKPTRRNGNVEERAKQERMERERAEKERAEKARQEAEAREKREKNAREQQKAKEQGGGGR